MSKANLIYETLRGMIESGQIAPGAFIDRPALVRQLGCSRQPIAAAIDKLAFEGLVTVQPQHGSFASELDRAAIADWFLVRTALEAEFARRLALAAAASKAGIVIDALSANLRRQSAAMMAEDIDQFYELDVEFHEVISRFVEAPEGQAILERAQVYLARARRILLPAPGRMQVVLDEHRAILVGLRSGSTDNAAAAMRAHLERVAHDLELTLAPKEKLATGQS
ncbi:MAG: GntR family transcriptional regulator [Rhodobacteraceae bacterium]|nr:GntR family transcriptional regulator [Paracoccaceae bacterium]